MKKSTLIVLLVASVFTVFANTKNMGATLTVVNGTTVTNIGNFENVSGTINNDGIIEIVDGVFDNSGTQTVGGLVVFTGTDAGLDGFTRFNDVELNTTNSTELLGGLSVFENNLFVKSGNIVLVGGGGIDYGVNGNLVYNGSTPTTSGYEFPFHFATFNPKTVRINNAAGVTIGQATGQVLYTLILEQGTLTSNGKLFMASTAVQTGIVDDFSGAYTGTIAGSMTVDRYVTNPVTPASPPNRFFHYIGSPLVGANASGWADDFSLAVMNNAVNGSPVIPLPDCNPRILQYNSPYGGLFTFDESLVTFCQYQGWRVRTGVEPVTRAKGFAGIIGTGLIDQSGTYANSDVSLTLSTTGTDPNYEGFHLVSNPFCAPMDWDVNYSQMGGAASDIDGNAYVYNPNGGNYIVFNNLNQGFLGTSQGFFIRAKPAVRTSGAPTFSATMDKDSRVTTNNNTYYRVGQPYEFALGIKVTSPAGSKEDETLIAFDPTFKDEFDVALDANKMYSDVGTPSIYTQAMNGDKLAIHAIPVNTGLITIPLSVKPEATGSFTLDFDQVHTFPSTMMITLEDKTTGTFQDIRRYPQYTFSATLNDTEERFLLHFTPQLIVNTEATDCSGRNGNISLQQEGGVIWDYTLMDEEGNLIITKEGFTDLDTISQLAPGTYTIRLSHSSGYQTYEEVVVHGVPMVQAGIVASAVAVEQSEELTFEATGNATQYSWDMGDGTVLSNVNSHFRYIYDEPGTYTVRLIGSNGVCTDEVTLNITVTAKEETAVENPNPNPTDPSTGVPGTDDIAQYLTVYHVDGKLFIKQTIEKGDSRLTASIFNGIGQQMQLINGVLPYNQLQVYNLNDLPAGPFFVRAIVGDEAVTKKIIVVR